MMCNLYRLDKPKRDIAMWFDVIDALGGANLGKEVYPGYPGAVVADGRLCQMNWGFPLVMQGRNGQALRPKPVNNTRTDKLDSYFWRHSFEERRCLIPVTAWAEAEGIKGKKTRTWMSLSDNTLFACAGIWRASDEWGDCYSMVMTDSAGPAAAVHSRMPVLLRPEDYAGWVSGSSEEARALCRPWSSDLTIERTSEGWGGRGAAPVSSGSKEPEQASLF